jgi:hypothetical protein
MLILRLTELTIFLCKTGNKVQVHEQEKLWIYLDSNFHPDKVHGKMKPFLCDMFRIAVQCSANGGMTITFFQLERD